MSKAGFGWLNMASTVNYVQISHFSRPESPSNFKLICPRSSHKIWEHTSLLSQVSHRTPLGAGCISELGPGLGKSLCTDYGAGAEFLALVR